MSQLWNKGRPVNAQVLAFCSGDDPILDRRLVPYDVRASIAHAEMLAACGHLSADECEQLRRELSALADDHERGLWQIEPEEEDVHTALENRLSSVGKKLHFGRSRNDQVLAALRLYLIDAIANIRTAGEAVCSSLHHIAEHQGNIPIPGYTHGQRAMPSSVDLWASGHASEINDDLDGLSQTLRRISKNPLGSAAGYGLPAFVRIDRQHTTKSLGFHQIHEPVTAVQLSRGKAEAHVLFELVLLLKDCGRLSADICLYNSGEFGFVTIDEPFTTGSSIMPQKKNPDVFEIVRGRSSLALGRLVETLQIAAGLPSGYHRDLQGLKRPLFEGIDLAMEVLPILAMALKGIRFDANRTTLAMGEELYATEKAYKLVQEKGLAFRDAYRSIAAGCATKR